MNDVSNVNLKHFKTARKLPISKKKVKEGKLDQKSALEVLLLKISFMMC